MNDDQLLDDIKQLLQAELSQTEERIVTQLRMEFRSEIGGLIDEVHDGFAGIGDSTTEQNDQLSNHEVRIAKIEARAV
jgi:hypothetical protein